MKNEKKHERSAALDWLVVLLFFCGVALIAAGLWQMWPPIALVFLGLACLYVAGCIGMAAKFPERTDKK